MNRSLLPGCDVTDKTATAIAHIANNILTRTLMLIFLLLICLPCLPNGINFLWLFHRGEMFTPWNAKPIPLGRSLFLRGANQRLPCLPRCAQPAPPVLLNRVPSGCSTGIGPVDRTGMGSAFFFIPSGWNTESIPPGCEICGSLFTFYISRFTIFIAGTCPARWLIYPKQPWAEMGNGVGGESALICACPVAPEDGTGVICGFG